MKVTMVLIGAHEGQTVTYGRGTSQHTFVNGKLELEGPHESLVGQIKYLGRYYQAFPQGSHELDAARRALKEGRTYVGVSEASKPSQESEDTGGADDEDRNNEGSASQSPESGDGGSASGSASGQEGADAASTGNGLGPVVSALKKLDPNNANHWRADGLPRMEAIEAFMGRTDVTRGDVSKAWPGFDRELARNG